MSTPATAPEPNEQSQEALITPQDRSFIIEAAELFGATRMINEIANRFGAQTMRMLQMVREKKVWREYGYKSFDDLLDNHPQSPMSKHQFYEREKALGIEGGETFNALNALRVPISKRKLLKTGQVEVTGDNIKIGEQEFNLKDEASVILAFNLFVSRDVQQTSKIERGTKELDAKKRKIGELEGQLSHGGMFVDGTAHMRALILTLGDHSMLNQEVAKIEDETERQRFGQEALERLSQAKLELEEALGFREPTDGAFDPLDPRQ